MRRRHTNYFLFILVALAAAPAFAANINQTNAQQAAENLNRQGSDQSMQNATTSAMKALMHFEQGEMPSAISNGMNAYGKYRNSEDLDKMGDKNTLNQASMGSLDGSSVSGAVKKTSTTFRRLDPSFLRQGEAGKIAAEFEQRTGMKREDFLKEMSNVSEQKISRNDPHLMEKVFERFEGFVKKIPNAEFRNHVQQRVDSVPATVRNGLIGKAIGKFASFLSGGGGGAPEAPVAQVPTPAPTAGKAEAAPVAAPAATATSAVTAPTATATQAKSSDDSKNALLGNVLNAAMNSQAVEPTIFEMVTRQYRELTPGLTGKP